MSTYLQFFNNHLYEFLIEASFYDPPISIPTPFYRLKGNEIASLQKELKTGNVLLYQTFITRLLNDEQPKKFGDLY